MLRYRRLGYELDYKAFFEASGMIEDPIFLVGDNNNALILVQDHNVDVQGKGNGISIEVGERQCKLNNIMRLTTMWNMKHHLVTTIAIAT
jgi:hypothetical protein